MIARRTWRAALAWLLPLLLLLLVAPAQALETSGPLNLRIALHDVDRDREYVAGHSNGAFMANYLGAKLGGRLAAIASMAGTVGLHLGLEIPSPTAP